MTAEELLAKLRAVVPADMERFVNLDRQMLPCEVIHYVRLHFTPAPAEQVEAALAAERAASGEATETARADDADGSIDEAGDSESGGDSTTNEGHGAEGGERSGRRNRRRRRRGRGRDRDGARETAGSGASAHDDSSGNADHAEADADADGGTATAVSEPPTRSAQQDSRPEPEATEPEKPAWKPLRSLYGAAMRRLRPGETGQKRE